MGSHASSTSSTQLAWLWVATCSAARFHENALYSKETRLLHGATDVRSSSVALTLPRRIHISLWRSTSVAAASLVCVRAQPIVGPTARGHGHVKVVLTNKRGTGQMRESAVGRQTLIDRSITWPDGLIQTIKLEGFLFLALVFISFRRAAGKSTGAVFKNLLRSRIFLKYWIVIWPSPLPRFFRRDTRQDVN